jgi:hypothetical protein
MIQDIPVETPIPDKPCLVSAKIWPRGCLITLRVRWSRRVVL